MKRAMELNEMVTSLLESDRFNPSGMYQFFPAQSKGDDVIVYDPEDAKTEIERFNSLVKQRTVPLFSRLFKTS